MSLARNCSLIQLEISRAQRFVWHLVLRRSDDASKLRVHAGGLVLGDLLFQSESETADRPI